MQKLLSTGTRTDGPKFVPADGRNSYCDLWFFEGRDEPERSSGDFNDKLALKEYLAKEPSDAGVVGAVRVIFTSMRDDQPFRVAWTEDDFKLLLSTFGLPEETRRLLGEFHPMSLIFEPNDKLGPKNWSYSFCNGYGSNEDDAVLLGSYDPVRNISYAWKIGVEYTEGHCIVEDYLKTAVLPKIHQPPHPYFLCLAFADIYAGFIKNLALETVSSLTKIEVQTRQTVLPHNNKDLPEMTMDFTTMLQLLNQRSVAANYGRTLVRQILRSLETIDTALASPTALHVPEGTAALERYIAVMRTMCDYSIVSLDSIERRCQIQVQYIYNSLALADGKLNVEVARDSRLIALATGRDSMAMKSIAILTMFFLPATFVATLFAIPTFDWSAASTRDVTGPHFWVYWAVSIPLTLLVLAIWSAWTWYQLRQHARENSQVKEHAKEEKEAVEGTDEKKLPDEEVGKATGSKTSLRASQEALPRRETGISVLSRRSRAMQPAGLPVPQE